MNNNQSLLELKEFWFNNPNYWFGCSHDIDILIKNKYFDLLLFNKNLDFINSLENNSDYDFILAKIILFDQISRHCFRNEREKIKDYDILALHYFELIKNDIEKYKPEERCFLLLPYRHTFQKDKLEIVLQYIKNWFNLNPEISIYRRFYSATLSSLSKINSQIQSENEYVFQRIDSSIPENLLSLRKRNDEFVNSIEFNEEEVNSVLDNNSCKFNSILLSNLEQNININFNHPIYLEFSKQLNNLILPSENKILLSISGGVDSMVCAYLLYLFNIQFNNKYNIECITINYENRHEQNIEVFMLNKWLKLLGFKHFVRHISEIKRARDHERDIYESITREIRFDMYKNIGGVVILGHNKDDSLENIFSNIKKRRSYRNLYGMNQRSEEKNVNIIRPILKIWKKDIIQFAINNNIPFVYDSTPSWSERGKMRDILIPQMNSFDPEIINGLFDMVDNFKEIYDIYEKMTPNIVFSDKTCYYINQEIYFYEYLKKIVYQIMNHYSLKPIKNKSILNLSEELKRKNMNRITLSKELVVQVINDKIVFFII